MTPREHQGQDVHLCHYILDMELLGSLPLLLYILRHVSPAYRPLPGPSICDLLDLLRFQPPKTFYRIFLPRFKAFQSPMAHYYHDCYTTTTLAIRQATAKMSMEARRPTHADIDRVNWMPC